MGGRRVGVGGRWQQGVLVLVATGMSPGAPLLGQEPTGEIRGLVVDAGSALPIANAQVRIAEERRDVATRADGSFVLRPVAPGPHLLTVSALGYDEFETAVEVTGGEPTVVRVQVRPAPLGLSEIVVTPGRFGIMGTSAPVTRQTLTREDLETHPQLGEDVFRSVQRLPGVSSGDISTRLNVRGGSDQELLVTVDGTELYEPYHLKDFDGVLGIIDVQSVGGIDMITGGFPVEFGDKTAGVFNMQTVDPPVQRTRTAIGLSIMNVSVSSRGTFADGDGSWLASLRRGYLDIALALTNSEGNFSPNYWDALAKVRYRMGTDHTISLHFLNASDKLTVDEDDDPDYVRSRWTSAYAWLGWEADFGARVHASTVASFGRLTRDRMGYEETPDQSPGLQANFADDHRTFDVVGLKQGWSVELGDDAIAKLGFDARIEGTDYDYLRWSLPRVEEDGGEPAAPDTLAVLTAPDGNELGAYAALRVRPMSRLTMELGVRYDRQSYSGDEDLAPRVLAALEVTDRTQLRASWGRYYQSQGLQDLSVGDGETEFSPSEWANQIAVGLEHTFPNRLNVRLEAYRRSIRRPQRRFFNLSREILAFPEAEEDRVRLEPEEARARGAEVMLTQNAGRFSWSASYALSATEGLVDGRWIPRYFDQTHAFTTLGSYATANGWQFSLGWQIHTGWPITPEVWSGGIVGTDPDTGQPVVNVDHAWGPVNADRLPAYHRLDLRVSRAFEVGDGLLHVFLDVFNVYNRGNLRSYAYDVHLVNGQIQARRVGGDELLPILPSFGVRWEF